MSTRQRLLLIMLLSLPLLLMGNNYYDYWEKESIKVGEYFACSSECLFAFDENGGIKWKVSIEEMPEDIMDSPDFLCLSWDRKINIYDRRNGELLLEERFPEKIWALGKVKEHPEIFLAVTSDKVYLMEADSGITMTLETEPEMNEILKIAIEKEGVSIEGEITISPVQEINIGISKKYIFGFLPDGKMKWKIERGDYTPEEGWGDYLELRALKGIKTIKRSTGETVWEKRFVYPIEEYEGRTYRKTKVTIETGKIYTLDLETGELEEKKE